MSARDLVTSVPATARSVPFPGPIGSVSVPAGGVLAPALAGSSSVMVSAQNAPAQVRVRFTQADSAPAPASPGTVEKM